MFPPDRRLGPGFARGTTGAPTRRQRRQAPEAAGDCRGPLRQGAAGIRHRHRRTHGGREARVWRIRRIADDLYERWLYEGRCEDLRGRAFGRRSGNAIHGRYRFNLKRGARTLPVDCDKRVVRRSPAIALDRAQLGKGGLRLGSVTLCYQKT
ncbi:MAG TPA: DUF3833 family protein [Stellaceae bacterium]|nr:DUF3833 family protein [Stellaceae bacterium]